MESSARAETKLNPSFLPSPNSHSSNSSSSSNAPITRSEPNNPYPTTFVQADTTSFKQVVQMLTGSSQTVNKKVQHKTSDLGPGRNPIPPVKSTARKQGYKLFERRNSMKNGFKISPLSSGLVRGSDSNLNPYGFSPRKSEILSPSMLDFPSLVLSPVTPLLTDPFNKGPNPIGSGLSYVSGLDTRAEEKAIAEKGFYLHSSPRQSEPKLLPLFPVTSPKLSGSSSSS
ncbi:hypothetical protein QQ045_026010 [Rhodiola kirilowii]